MFSRATIALLIGGLAGAALLPAATSPPPKKKTTYAKGTASKGRVYKRTVPKAAPKAGTSRAVARKTSTPAAKTTTATRRTTRSTTLHASQRVTPRSTWRASQAAPTPDRYKEIQTALAQKGYLHGEASGRWDQESIDALRRFQQDQNLEANGKLDSLSIIALGLGPKY